MTDLSLYRIKKKGATYGAFFVGQQPICMALECPWVPDDQGGVAGLPFESCVPDGTYHMEPATWTSGGGRKVDTWVLINENYGVYHQRWQRRYNRDRWGCYIHPGNWVSQISGCILPGARFDHEQEAHIYQSSDSLQRLMDAMGGLVPATLKITSYGV